MGIFDNGKVGLFTTYHAVLEFRDKVMGGTPNDPLKIAAWIRKNTGITDETELRQLMIRTMEEMDIAVPEEATYDDVVKISERMALTRNTNGFKADEKGLYLESRVIKAGMKESTNILASNDRWGPTRKGPKSYVAERIFIIPDKIYLDRQDPDGTELFIGHTNGPKGPQSNLTDHEYVERARIEFDVMVTLDALEPKKREGRDNEPWKGQDFWPPLWLHLQENMSMKRMV